jgi:hypothetical protein
VVEYRPLKKRNSKEKQRAELARDNPGLRGY